MKHKLRIEELDVASFEAVPAPTEARGTVRANGSDPQTCYPVYCYSGVESCLGTCVQENTCGMSCDGTCVPAYCTGEES